MRNPSEGGDDCYDDDRMAYMWNKEILSYPRTAIPQPGTSYDSLNKQKTVPNSTYSMISPCRSDATTKTRVEAGVSL